MPIDHPDPSKITYYRSIFISDTHLGLKDCQAKLLLDFLARTDSDYLYLVGDIIDCWKLRRHWYWPQAHNDVIQAVLRKAKSGTKVVYLPGNHDEPLRDFLGMEFGAIEIVDDLIHTAADGRRYLVMHGDQFDVVIDHAKWLAVIGHQAYAGAMKVSKIFNFVRRKMGFDYWSLSAYLKHKVKRVVEHMSQYEAALIDAARMRDADGIICGHIHHAEIRDVDGVWYMNDGDWVESCTALVEDAAGAFSILKWRDRYVAEKNGV